MLQEAKLIHVPQITQIHMAELAGDFLPSLGFNFLKTVYEGIIGKKGIWSIIDIENGKVKGFVIGTRDINYFFREALSANFFKLIFYLCIQLISTPLLIKQVFETYSYPKKDTGPKAELVVIAVSKKSQGDGIGKMLISELEKVFKKEDIKVYKLTVHQDKNSVNFYEHLEFKKKGQFSLYGKLWYIYEKTIS